MINKFILKKIQITIILIVCILCIVASQQTNKLVQYEGQDTYQQRNQQPGIKQDRQQHSFISKRQSDEEYKQKQQMKKKNTDEDNTKNNNQNNQKQQQQQQQYNDYNDGPQAKTNQKQNTKQKVQQNKNMQNHKDTIHNQQQQKLRSKQNEDEREYKKTQEQTKQKQKKLQNIQQNKSKLIQFNNQKKSHQNQTKIAIQLYIAFFIQHYPAIIQAYLRNVISPKFISIVQHYLYALIDYMSRKLPILVKTYYQFYKILIDNSKPKVKKIYYDNNYANLYGGAKIIMKSSSQIKSINSILQDGIDKYMYTDEQLPIKIIIGLNEQIAINSISIQSYQMYSCITKQFKVQGKFTMDDKKWVYLGTFKAEDKFGQQRFETQRKIVRYIKITILSAYGKWSYFTLTQVQIRGKNLFADALEDKNQASSGSSDVKINSHQFQSHKQEQQDHPNICHNEFKPPNDISEPHQSNLITSLITKIDNLQLYNSAQRKQLQNLNNKLKDVSNILINKTQQNKFYQTLIKQYQEQANRNYYVIIMSVGLSAVTLLFLICLCLIRRKQLLGKNRDKFSIKKSNSSH